MSGACRSTAAPDTVREHPAQKLHVESQRSVPDRSLRFEPARLEQAARELARARHGGLLAARDMERWLSSSAITPLAHTPCSVAISHGGDPISAWTMLAKPGNG